jgi:hypothetical protein
MAALGECHGDLHAAHAVVADDDEFAISGEVVNPRGSLAHGENARAGDGGDGDFLPFPDVDQFERLSGGEALLDFGGRGGFDGHSLTSIPGKKPVLSKPMAT